MSISIYISTCGNRIKNLDDWEFHKDVQYFVIWQKNMSSITNLSFPHNVKIIIEESIGVTNSRNIALLHCTTDWLWFMDDDVFIPPPSIENLLGLMSKYTDKDILITSVYFGESIKSSKKIGKTKSIIKAFSIGTIQIICNPAIARKYNCYFPINMGAGTKYPVCDEPIFISRMIKKANVRLCEINTVYVVHPPVSSGLYYNDKNYIISRAMLFREVFGYPICILYSILYYFKHFFSIKWNFRYLFYYLRSL